MTNKKAYYLTMDIDFRKRLMSAVLSHDACSVITPSRMLALELALQHAFYSIIAESFFKNVYIILDDPDLPNEESLPEWLLTLKSSSNITDRIHICTPKNSNLADFINEIILLVSENSGNDKLFIMCSLSSCFNSAGEFVKSVLYPLLRIDNVLWLEVSDKPNITDWMQFFLGGIIYVDFTDDLHTHIKCTHYSVNKNSSRLLQANLKITHDGMITNS